ncbi:hypothetical protein RAAC3_TM7C00001G0274 [Candidatus Saccharibacteria bacterium RAAC3_TM7_1]|nr:hypothetical protein RAAC3_TM7C00001G0274 [Candidatus Saccharibacteria bacterium RAAC3_TM7_1]
MSEALVESPYVQETVAEMRVENEYNTQELAFPKLDGILFPLVVTNAEVVAPCPWMGGAEVPLTVALNNYCQPMTEENADQVIADVYDFLANQVSEEKEVLQEPAVEVSREEKSEPVVVEVKKENTPQNDLTRSDEPPKKAESVTNKSKPLQQPIETAIKPKAETKPSVDKSAEKDTIEHEEAKQVVPIPVEETDVSPARHESPRSTSGVHDVAPEHEHRTVDRPVALSVEATPQQDDNLTATQDKNQELVTESITPATTLDLEMDNQSEPLPDSKDDESLLYENSDIDPAVQALENEIVLEPLEYFSQTASEMVRDDNEIEPVIDESMAESLDPDHELLILDQDELYSSADCQEVVQTHWGVEELETVLDEDATRLDSLVETELAISEVNKLLLSLSEPSENPDEVAFAAIDEEHGISDNKETPEELETAYTDLSDDIQFAYEIESADATMRGLYAGLSPEDDADLSEILKEIDEPITYRGTRGTTRTLTTAAGTLKTALYRATAIGRSALRPHIIVSVR